LHVLEVGWVGRFQAKWVESNITRSVVGSQEACLCDRNILRVNLTMKCEAVVRYKAFTSSEIHIFSSYPSDVEASTLRSSDTNGQKDPEDSWNLTEVADTRAGDLRIEKERRSLNEFTREETKNSQHTNTSVSDLGFTVTSHGGAIC
jgi:hypothetical protein